MKPPLIKIEWEKEGPPITSVAREGPRILNVRNHYGSDRWHYVSVGDDRDWANHACWSVNLPAHSHRGFTFVLE